MSDTSFPREMTIDASTEIVKVHVNPPMHGREETENSVSPLSKGESLDAIAMPKVTA